MNRLPIAAALAASLSATAALAAKVNVYTERQPELIQPIFDAFSAETGVTVNVLFASKGLIERMKAEGARSPADVYLTADIGNIAAAVDAGVTQAVESEALAANIPAEYRDPAGHWFAPTTRARIVYASKDRVPEGAVTTYEDLADPKWRGKICTRSGSHSYNIALVAAAIAHHGREEAKAWLAGVKANLARKPQGNDRAQVKAVWAGECDIAIGNTYYMGKMLEEDEEKPWADAVRIVYPVFEGGGAHMNISGMALTAAAPNRENGVKFMEYLSGDAAQALYAEANYEFPVKPGVARSELVAGWGAFTPDDLPLAEIAKYRAEALKVVEEVDFDG